MYVSEHQWVGPRGEPAEPSAVNQFPDNAPFNVKPAGGEAGHGVGI